MLGYLLLLVHPLDVVRESLMDRFLDQRQGRGQTTIHGRGNELVRYKEYDTIASQNYVLVSDDNAMTMACILYWIPVRDLPQTVVDLTIYHMKATRTLVSE
jgi:hypothetical protein